LNKKLPYKSRKNVGKRRTKPSILIIIAISAVVVIAAGVIVGINSIQSSKVNPNSSAQTTGSNPSSNNNNKLSISNLVAEGSAVKGNTSAKVTLVEFGDFQCHFCARFATQTEPQIDQQYVKTGKISMVFKHFAWYGPDSVTAAMAAQCANDQAKFWQFHDILYQNQGEINSGWASKDNLKKFTSQVQGLDRNQFDSCLDSGKYKSLVQSDIYLSTSLGFQGTPGFIVEKSDGSHPIQIAGAYPFPTFQQTIDKMLSES
jgi:protein-disulfide isomerase